MTKLLAVILGLIVASVFEAQAGKLNRAANQQVFEGTYELTHK